MCKPFSCIVKSDLTLLVSSNFMVHSHSQILKEAGLVREVSVDQYARVELVPNGNAYGSDPDSWVLTLDEEREPSWWKENLPEVEGRIREAAHRWKAKLLALKEVVVENSEELICLSDATITVQGGLVRTLGSSQPTITVQGGEVRTLDSSQPTITVQGGEVNTWDSSQPTIKDLRKAAGS